LEGYSRVTGLWEGGKNKEKNDRKLLPSRFFTAENGGRKRKGIYVQIFVGIKVGGDSCHGVLFENYHFSL